MSNSSSYQDAIKSLRKQTPKAFERKDIEGFSSGSLALDYLTGIGGFPQGCLTEICGWEASGKTTLALAAYAAAQRRGLTPTYLDIELGVDMNYAAAIGCDFLDERKGIYLTPATFDDALVVIDKMLGHTPIIFVDSVAGLITQEALDADLGEGEALGLRARKLSAVLPVLTKKMRDTGTSVVLINQLRETISTGFADRFAPKHKSQGGRAIPYYAWLRINTSQVKKGDVKRKRMSPLSGKEEEVPVSSEHAFDVMKSKVGVAHQRAPFYIRFDDDTGVYGVDNIQTLLNMALAAGQIIKKGSYYNLKVEGMGEAGVFSCQGEEALYRHVAAKPDLVAGIAAALGLQWSTYTG